jgi:uncharacterized membrane protein YfcA
MEWYVLLFSFFLIALIYSSVGFGGGSSYLALMAQPFFALLPDTIRPLALLCNIIVVVSGTIIFLNEVKLSWKDIWPFLVSSVPLAFVGGIWKLKESTFFILLGFTLLLASVFMWIRTEERPASGNRLHHPIGRLVMGGSIGFLSGLVSIGGGIFLSPILHLTNWAEGRKISALASVFILVNSVSGLLGQFSRGLPLPDVKLTIGLMVAVFAGGQIGSRLGARKFNPLYIRRITAALIFVAAVNILRDHLILF